MVFLERHPLPPEAHESHMKGKQMPVCTRVEIEALWVPGGPLG